MAESLKTIDKWVFAAGLLLPGGGQLRRGELFAAALVCLSTAFLWLSATLELVVNNMRGYPAPLKIAEELAALRTPVVVVPHVIVAVIFAAAMHVGAAWFAARSSNGFVRPASGEPTEEGAPEVGADPQRTQRERLDAAG